VKATQSQPGEAGVQLFAEKARIELLAASEMMLLLEEEGVAPADAARLS
jgi:hypothetical protein